MTGGLRPWIGLLAGASFLAGLAAGVLIGLDLRPAPREAGPFADYEAMLVERFDLSSQRARGLRVVLDQYQRQIDSVKDRNAHALEPELARLGVTFRNVVRDTVLPPDRRDEFRALSGDLLAAR